jgi:hypothetical protein
MGVQVVWDDAEKRALRYDLSGRWQWDEFFPVYNQAVEIIKPLTYDVHFIVNPADDVTRGGYLPPNVLSQIGKLNKINPPNVGVTYVIGTPVLQVLYDVFRKVYPRIAHKYVHVRSLEEARRLIAALPHEATQSKV